jgi:hypothetical protein
MVEAATLKGERLRWRQKSLGDGDHQPKTSVFLSVPGFPEELN